MNDEAKSLKETIEDRLQEIKKTGFFYGKDAIELTFLIRKLNNLSGSVYLINEDGYLEKVERD